MEFLFVLLALLLLVVACGFYFSREKANYDPQTHSYAWETPEVREKNRKAVRAWLEKQRAGRQTSATATASDAASNRHVEAAAGRSSRTVSHRKSSVQSRRPGVPADAFYDDPEAWAESYPDYEDDSEGYSYSSRKKSSSRRRNS